MHIYFERLAFSTFLNKDIILPLPPPIKMGKREKKGK